jgi:hypothetical protein
LRILEAKVDTDLENRDLVGWEIWDSWADSEKFARVEPVAL